MFARRIPSIDGPDEGEVTLDFGRRQTDFPEPPDPLSILTVFLSEWRSEVVTPRAGVGVEIAKGSFLALQGLDKCDYNDVLENVGEVACVEDMPVT